MRKQYTVVALLLVMAMVLAGCSMDDVKEKFVGSTESATGASAEEGTPVIIENYDPTEFVTLGDYKNVEVDCTVTEGEIKQQIDYLLANKSTVKEIKKGKCKSGDSVNIDFTGKVDGKEVDGEVMDDQMIILGNSGHIDGFDDGIIGMKPGKKKELKLTFPDDYKDKELAGKEIVYTIKLNYIAVPETPELTEDFVKENTAFSSIKEYKENIKNEIINQKKINAANTALQTITEEAKVNKIPDTLKDAYVRQLDHTFHYNIERQSNGVSFDVVLGNMGMTKADYEKELETQAKTYAKTQLVFEAIAAKENMTPTDADIQAYVDQVLESYSQAAAGGEDESASEAAAEEEVVSIDILKEQYEKNFGNAISFDTYLKTSCTYEKVMTFISGSMKIKE